MNTNLATKCHSLLLALSFSFVIAALHPAVADDKDGDGIDDDKEYQLLQRFAPVLYPNETHDTPGEGVGVPVSITWLLRNSLLLNYCQPEHVTLSYPSVAAAIQFIGPSGGCTGFFISNTHIPGDSPGDERTWGISAALGEGVYGRVWRPWPGSYPKIYSVQYYVLLTWNETAYSGGFGNHEGDWLCVDYAVDVRCGFDNPPIIHAIYHNHGPQMFVCPELLEFDERGHPVVYVEKGTNEAWPNAGDRGVAGWSRSRGFTTDGNWDDAGNWMSDLADVLSLGTQDVSEYKIHREHFGAGRPYVTHDVPNIGDINPMNQLPVSLCGDEGLFILKYNALYGIDTDSPPFVDLASPNGPPFQNKMWNRDWTKDGVPLGPWTPARAPFSSDTSGFHLYEASTNNIFTAQTWPSDQSYNFFVPQLRDTTHVEFSAPQEGNGSDLCPYRNLLLAIAMTQAGGTVVMQPGAFAMNFEVNQMVTLTATNGVVTIGQ
jgi:hypothetical protein